MTQNRIHPYIPAFRRYPPEILLAVGRIEAARRTLRDALILPAQEEILRRDARVGSIHYSNLIEGNELPVIEALRAAEHELEPTSKAKLELVNYVSALEFVEREHRAGSITYTPEFLKQLHGVLTKGLGRADGRFKPHHEAEWRDGWARVADGIATYHVAPDPDDVPQLMADRLDWLERKRHEVEYPVPILAGIAHFEVAEVHPFADYNGRAARLFAIAIFYRESFLERPLFSPERYYAENRDAYFAALRAIKTTHNLEAWLAYHVEGLATEFERVAEKVRELNQLTQALPLPLQLTRSQDRAIAAFTAEGRKEITIPEYVELTGVSRKTASRELNGLTSAGVLRSSGSTRDRKFSLAGRPTTPRKARPRGRPRAWTEDRIRTELRKLVARLGRWPTEADFRHVGELSLYAAMRRAGGDQRWKADLARGDDARVSATDDDDTRF